MSDPPELIVFVGLQASGKSTFYRANFSETHVHVSKDLYPRSAKKDRRQTEEIEAALRSGRSVVVDNTNPTVEVRAPLISLGRAAGAKIIAYNFRSSVRGAVERNRNREGKERVPDAAVYITASKLRPATAEEGFDEVRTVSIEPETGQGWLF
jgi:predicted kinase